MDNIDCSIVEQKLKSKNVDLRKNLCVQQKGKK